MKCDDNETNLHKTYLIQRIMKLCKYSTVSMVLPARGDLPVGT